MFDCSFGSSYFQTVFHVEFQIDFILYIADHDKFCEFQNNVVS